VVGSGRRCLAVDSSAGLSVDARHASTVVAEEAVGAKGSASASQVWKIKSWDWARRKGGRPEGNESEEGKKARE
jgi:hypothetical protein